MTLFEECKEALSDNFVIIQDDLVGNVIDILKQFPFTNGNVVWPDINYTDYVDINEILKVDIVKDKGVFVVADDTNIPIFKTDLKLLAENIYDVTALSAKLFIFNNDVILQPLFPTEIIRLGVRN